MIDCALIGCGYWGSKLKRYIEESEDFDLKYVCNSKTDLGVVWNDKEVSAVVVATRNDNHYSITKSALLSGKDVLVEKPLALTTAECEELRDLAIGEGLLLMVEYTYTFSKAMQKAQALVKTGEIGKVLGFEMAARHLGRFYGGSVYWLLGSHLLSILDMFVSLKTLDFRKVDLVRNDGNVETGIIIFGNKNVTGQIVVSLNYPGKETSVIIYGQGGTIIYNPAYQSSLQVENYERLEWVVSSELPKERTNFDFDESHNLRYAIRQFAEGLCGVAPSNIDRAISITRILEELQCRKSA